MCVRVHACVCMRECDRVCCVALCYVRLWCGVVCVCVYACVRACMCVRVTKTSPLYPTYTSLCHRPISAGPSREG